MLSLVLAAVAAADDPNQVALVVIVFLIGIGQAMFGPTYSALLPRARRPRGPAGAISLNSAQMNGSRVIGPIIGALLDSTVGASWVFVVNGLDVPVGDLVAAVGAPARARRAHVGAARAGIGCSRASRSPGRTRSSAGASSRS